MRWDYWEMERFPNKLHQIVKGSVPSIEINFNEDMFFLGKSEIGLASDVVPATVAP